MGLLHYNVCSFSPYAPYTGGYLDYYPPVPQGAPGTPLHHMAAMATGHNIPSKGANPAKDDS